MLEVNAKDLTGDVVYDHLKTLILKDHVLVGGIIEEKRIVAPTEARKIMHIFVKKEGAKTSAHYAYNYNKIKRSLR